MIWIIIKGRLKSPVDCIKRRPKNNNGSTVENEVFSFSKYSSQMNYCSFQYTECAVCILFLEFLRTCNPRKIICLTNGYSGKTPLIFTQKALIMVFTNTHNTYYPSVFFFLNERLHKVLWKRCPPVYDYNWVW